MLISGLYVYNEAVKLLLFFVLFGNSEQTKLYQFSVSNFI